jgi:hypothetical protein
MAYSAYQYSGGILYPEHASQIVIDSASDLESINLDALAPGSQALDCSTGDTYILSPGKEWSVMHGASGGGVSSVNGQIGTVALDASDVGALPSNTTYVASVNGSSGAVTGIQTTSNLVTSVSSSSTNNQYPSAKLFYDTIGNLETLLAAI